MKYFLLICVIIGNGCFSVAAQQRCRVMFYNVENFFDTQDDPLTADEEFTPWGTKHWTKARYVDKLRKIAQVIERVGEGSWPVLVGIAEVENRKVLVDLTEKTILAEGHYGIVHRDSPDRRGIDVALLYAREQFRLLTSDFLRLSFPEDTTIRTRDILYVKGVLQTDTLHVFVCHFPSMLGGERQSEWKRERAAFALRQKVDSIRACNTRAAILIFGDLNGKANTPAQKVLGTFNSDEEVSSEQLYNTGYFLLKKNYGSYRYQGRWQTIDHIIVSGSLLNGEAGWKASRYLTIYNAPFLLEEDTRYFGFKPKPGYRGPRYIGGYSDHLPVYLDLMNYSDSK